VHLTAETLARWLTEMPSTCGQNAASSAIMIASGSWRTYTTTWRPSGKIAANGASML